MANPNKKLNYTQKDSAILFLLILILPQTFAFIVYFILYSICSNTGMTTEQFDGSAVISYLENFSIYLSFAAIYLVYNKSKNIHQTKAAHFSFKGINIVQLLIVVAIGLVCLFGLSSISNLFAYFLGEMGYNVTGADFQLTNPIRFVIVELIVALLPAILEEFTIRGTVLQGLRNSNSNKKSVVLSAVLFMIMHLSLAQSVYQLFMGVVLALIVVYTDNIFYSIALHFINNFVIILDSYINYGAEVQPIVYASFMDYFLPIIIAIVAVIIVVLLLKLLKKVAQKQDSVLVEQSENTKNYTYSKNDGVPQIVSTENQQMQVKDFVQTEELSEKSALKDCFIVSIILWCLSVLLGFLG